MSIAHFDVIPEYVVIPDFQAGNTRFLTLALLHVQQIVFPRIGNFSQLVEFVVHPLADNSSPIHQIGRIGINFMFDSIPDDRTTIQLLPDTLQYRFIALLANSLDRLYRRQCHFQLNHLARRNTPHRYFRNEAFHIAYRIELRIDNLPNFGVAEKELHSVQPILDRLHIFQRKDDPPFEHTRPHWGDSPVYHVEQAFSPFVHRRKQFETPYREFIQSHISLLLDTRQRCNVRNLRMLRNIQIMKQRPRGDNGVGHIVNSETFEIFRLEVTQ